MKKNIMAPLHLEMKKAEAGLVPRGKSMSEEKQMKGQDCCLLNLVHRTLMATSTQMIQL